MQSGHLLARVGGKSRSEGAFEKNKGKKSGVSGQWWAGPGTSSDEQRTGPARSVPTKGEQIRRLCKAEPRGRISLLSGGSQPAVPAPWAAGSPPLVVHGVWQCSHRSQWKPSKAKVTFLQPQNYVAMMLVPILTQRHSPTLHHLR